MDPDVLNAALYIIDGCELRYVDGYWVKPCPVPKYTLQAERRVIEAPAP